MSSLVSVINWEQLISNVGVPSTVLLFFCFMFWRMSKAAAPYLKKGFDKHIEFVETAQTATERCATSSEETRKVLEKLHDNQVGIRKAFHHTANALDEIAGDNPRVAPHTEAIKKQIGTDKD